MKCPLLKITRPGLMTATTHPQDDCLEQECAWWDNVMGRCYLASMAISLGWVALHLGNIVEHMPYKKEYPI